MEKKEIGKKIGSMQRSASFATRSRLKLKPTVDSNKSTIMEMRSNGLVRHNASKQVANLTKGVREKTMNVDDKLKLKGRQLNEAIEKICDESIMKILQAAKEVILVTNLKKTEEKVAELEETVKSERVNNLAQIEYLKTKLEALELKNKDICKEKMELENDVIMAENKINQIEAKKTRLLTEVDESSNNKGKLLYDIHYEKDEIRKWLFNKARGN